MTAWILGAHYTAQRPLRPHLPTYSQPFWPLGQLLMLQDGGPGMLMPRWIKGHQPHLTQLLAYGIMEQHGGCAVSSRKRYFSRSPQQKSHASKG